MTTPGTPNPGDPRDPEKRPNPGPRPTPDSDEGNGNNETHEAYPTREYNESPEPWKKIERA